MGIELHLPPDGWAQLFAGKEEEFHRRLIRLAPEETQRIKITHPEAETRITGYFHQPQPYHLGPSEAIALDDVIFDNRDGTLTLPFMPEYASLAKQVDEEISTPHNSALSTWMAYGHVLHDQFSLEGLYQLHPATRGLPLAFNFYQNQEMIRLVETNWTRPCLIIRKNITRFKKLHVMLHRHTQIKRAQSEFLRKEFGVPESSRLKDFFHPPASSRRIYLTRTQRRKIINDEELTTFLKGKGFERWEDRQLNAMTIREQAALFNSAGIIISPHGSHFTNCFFCRPDVVLIELFKLCWVEFSDFAVLRSAAPRAHYAYLIDWRPWESALQALVYADIRVNVPELEKLFERMKLR